MHARCPWPRRHPGRSGSPANPGFPCRWFVRSSPYACVCPAPFFAAAVPVPAATELTFEYVVVVADGELDIDALGAFLD